MLLFRFRLSLALVVAVAAAVGAAETGTPFPAGTKVEVTTPSGTVAGVLEDRTTAGWVMVREPGRPGPTAIPERSVSFLRPTAPAAAPGARAGQAAPKAPAPKSPTPKTPASEEHFIFGQPRVTKPERFAFSPTPGNPVEGVTVLKRRAFTVGHYDKHKTPAWVAMRWTRAEYDVSESRPNHPRTFQADPELPGYAQTGKDYDHAHTKYQRGHMARHEDLSGFGAPGDPFLGTKQGCLMSNIVPQLQKGHTVWGRLEDEHREIVARPNTAIKTVWLISGPVFRGGEAEQVIGPDRVGAPEAVFKVIAWKKPDGTLTARGYVVRQDATGTNLKVFLRTIDDIEAVTGLDFFPESVF